MPVRIGVDSRHERIGRQHGKVEVAQPPGLALRGDEVLDVGVVASHGRHHRAATSAGGHDGAAHRVPDVHEGEWAGSVSADAAHRRASRAEGGEVVADPAALLHRQRGLAQMVEDRAEIVADVAHDEAVEQGDSPIGAGARQNAAGWQEPEVLQRFVEGLLPLRRIALHLRQRSGDAAPAVLDGEVDRSAVGGLEPVFRVPDLPGDWGGLGQSRAGVRLYVHVHDLLPFAGHSAPCDPIRTVARLRRGQGRRGAAAAGALATHPCGRRGLVAHLPHPNCLSRAAAAARSMRDVSVWRVKADPRNQPSERLSGGRSAMKQDGLV